MTTTNPVAQTREFLADALLYTAEWRAAKSIEFSDDPRNARSADALDAAVQFVKRANGPVIEDFARLLKAAEDSGAGVKFEYDFRTGMSRVAARYFFDDLPSQWDDRTHESL